MPMRRGLGRPPFPREHGAWAMVLTPVAVALLVLEPSLPGLLAMVGWLLAYSARGPVEALLGKGVSGKAGMPQTEPGVARRYLVLFGGGAAILLGAVALRQPVILVPLSTAGLLLLLVLWLVGKGQTRSLSAGVLAVFGLMAGAPLYDLAGDGTLSREGLVLTLAVAGFFTGSVFRVKALARERRAPAFRALSVLLHSLLLVAALASVRVWHLSPMVAVTLVPPLAWAIYGATRGEKPLSLMAIGKGEQWLTILFALLMMIAI